MSTVISAGVSVVRLAVPVRWNDDGDEVRFVCGLAATAEEHMGVLAALAEVLDDEASLERLRTTSDPAEIVQILDPA